mgnify:FL=1
MASPGLSRRNFMGVLPLTVLSFPSMAHGLDLGSPQPEKGQVGPRPGFVGPFSPEEAAAVAESSMAREIAGLTGKGYPCSEMMLLSALRRFHLPEEHLDAAAVFGGGVGKRDLCGFLTGGLMAIGFAAGEKYQDRRIVHQAGRLASNAYWEWWLSRGDQHCMGYGTDHEDSEEFVRMAQRAALKLEAVMGVLMDGGFEVVEPAG